MENIKTALSPSYSDTTASNLSVEYTENSMISSRSWIDRTFGAMNRGSIRSSIIALVSCAMGSGMLAFPSNARNSGLALGVMMVVLCAIISRISMYLILACSFETDVSTFSGLVEKCLGRKVKRIFEANIILYMFGSVTCLQIMFASFLWETCIAFGLDPDMKGRFILIFNMSFIVLNLPLSMLKDVYSLRYFVQMQLAIIAYIVVAMVVYFVINFDGEHILANVEYAIVDKKIFSSFASTFFGYIAHQMLLPLKSELKGASLKRMNKVCTRGTIITLMVYTIIMFVGYLTWFKETQTLVIENYKDPYFTVAKALMAFALFFSVSLNVNPLRLAILESINKKDSKKGFIMTTVILQVSSGLLAYIYPNVKSGFGLLGGFLGLNMVVVVPCWMYVKVFGWTSKSIVFVMISTCAAVIGWAGAVLSQLDKK